MRKLMPAILAIAFGFSSQSFATSHKSVVVKSGQKPKSKISFKNDMRRNGWKIVEDIPFNGKHFFPEIIGFLKPGEKFLDCVNNHEAMRQRAKELNANLGQHHAEYLLEHQELIPIEARHYFLLFPGTVWQDPYGRLSPYLVWNPDSHKWSLGFGGLWAGIWEEEVARLVCCHK